MKICITFFLALALFACADGATGRANFSGPTDNRMLHYFSSLPKGSEVSITSSGGKESTAIEIAKIIQSSHIRLIVTNYCLSSCAQYLLPASDRVIVENDSLIAFHFNSYAVNELALDSRQDADIIANANEALKLYEEEQIDSNFLLLSSFAVGPICYPDRKNRPANIITKFNNWIPSREILMAAGFKFEGYWPASGKEAMLLASKIYKEGTLIKYGDDIVTDKNMLVRTTCNELLNPKNNE